MNTLCALPSSAFGLQVRKLLTRTGHSWGISSSPPASIDDMATETGQRVEYEVTQGQKGPQAGRTRPV